MAYAIHKAVKETEGEADEDEEAASRHLPQGLMNKHLHLHAFELLHDLVRIPTCSDRHVIIRYSTCP